MITVPPPSIDELRAIPLFEHLRVDQLEWLAAHSEEVRAEANEIVYAQGTDADYFYVVIDGELQVTQDRNGTETLLALHRAGNYSGEVPLLGGTPYIATGRALQPTRLLRLDNQSFREMFSICPVIVSKLFSVLQQRIQATEALARQREKMAALGGLSAGLAHELNNPAAATMRASEGLRGTLRDIRMRTTRLSRDLSGEQMDRLVALQEAAAQHQAHAAPLDSLTQSDREEALNDWFSDHGVDDGYEFAQLLVSAGIDTDKLDALAADVGEALLPDVVYWLGASLSALSLMVTIEQSSKRMSELVKSIKSYTFMDQGERQQIDVHEGLENTARMMAYKLRQKNIQLERQYAADVPKIVAYGSELNQVWTNIIDNAIDALPERGTITLRTWHDGENVWVEISDNGVGIPPEIQTRIFEPFFTTKEPGKGTGLGLDIAHRIVVERHRGELRVDSVPGDTRFRIRLPIQLT